VNILSLEEVANPYEREIPLYPFAKGGIWLIDLA
jgi:hypothetical protein